jgi:hypothetical protein
MSARIFKFPKRPTPDVCHRAADEHLLAALAQRDALLTNDSLSKEYVDFRCVQSGLDGLAEYLRGEMPHLSDERLAEYLRTALIYYRRNRMELGE